MYLHYGRVINCVNAKTKYGPRLALNIQLEDGDQVACWSDVLDDASFLSKKPGDKVSLIKGVRGSYSLVEQEQPRNVRNIGGAGLKSVKEVLNRSNTLPSQTYFQTNGNGSNTVVNHQEDILDLPVLSDLDKRNMMAYIRSQSKLLKFCYETICKDFPDLAINDPRGARSLAVTLLISANTARDKYKL